jgi:hypothetical protein
MSYKLLHEANHVIRLADGAIIPEDTRNRDWREYQAWLAAGNMPEAADKPSRKQQDRLDELKQAATIAASWFLSRPDTVEFLRKTPAEQAVEIALMTPQQLSSLITDLTVAVSATAKVEYLE